MAVRSIWIALTAVVVLAAYGHIRLSHLGQKLDTIEQLPQGLAAQTAESIEAIDQAGKSVAASLREGLTSELAQTAKTVADQEAAALEERLRVLDARLAEQEAALKKAQAERERLQNGLPEQVDLDELSERYGDWKITKGWANSETFNTALGPIGFQGIHISCAYVPSSKRLAWLKIGKKDSSENSELIKTWISEAEQAKLHLGYTRQYRRTKPSDYGQYTESLFRKGDMYFKTYLQHDRVQGTYGRHSLKYTYYVETGSVARKEQYELEQYNEKLGS